MQIGILIRQKKTVMLHVVCMLFKSCQSPDFQESVVASSLCWLPKATPNLEGGCGIQLLFVSDGAAIRPEPATATR